MNEAYIERIAKAIWQIWTIKNNQIFNKKEIPKGIAIRMLKETLWSKKEIEQIYITKVKKQQHR